MDACTTPAAGDACAGQVTGVAGYLFTSLITSLMTSQCQLAGPHPYPEDMAPLLEGGPPADYDFIVIGGGSSGAVVASRLSEVPHWRVLLVEAGGDPPMSSEVPGMLFTLQQTDIDWGYRPHGGHVCKGMVDGRCSWPRGKVLGGCSTINAMLYLKGHPRDFDSWEQSGNPGWGYKDVLPYFQKSLPYLSLESYGHDDHPLKGLLLEGYKEMGYSHLDHITGENGFSNAPGTLTKGTRSNAAKAFLNPLKSRRNLHVAKRSHVTKVLIDPVTRATTGVRILHEGSLKDILVKKEVILSAGAINSPQLLLLSGIGPKEQLHALGISPILKDSPAVGKNLQDHLIFPGVIFSILKSNPTRLTPQLVMDATYQYLTRQTGFLAGIGITDLVGFVSTGRNPDPSYPDIQFHHIHFPLNDPFLIQSFLKISGYTPQVVGQLTALNAKTDLLIIIPTLLRPKSRGEITLRSADPSDEPEIRPGYLTDDDDLQTMLDGIEIAAKLGQTAAMQRIEAQLVGYAFPETEHVALGSREYWTQALGYIGSTIYHPVGTCRMGSERTSVVDQKLRIKGIKGLRVADASIMPDIVSANTNAACLMIGEKAADLVKEAWPQ